MRSKTAIFIASLIFCQLTFASSAPQSYLVTWDPHSVSSRDDFYKHLPEQASSLLELWKSKTIENVYLDPKQKDVKGQDITMVVFILQAKNKDHAHQLLANMPYVRHKVIDYKLEPIGSFWLGKYDPSLFQGS